MKRSFSLMIICMLYFPIFSKEDRFSIRELKMKIKSFVYLEYLMSTAVTIRISNFRFWFFSRDGQNFRIFHCCNMFILRSWSRSWYTKLHLCFIAACKTYYLMVLKNQIELLLLCCLIKGNLLKCMGMCLSTQ